MIPNSSHNVGFHSKVSVTCYKYVSVDVSTLRFTINQILFENVFYSKLSEKS